MPTSSEVFASVTVEQMRQRRGSKWTRYGDEILPCFVADMDFPLAPPIHNALSEQAAIDDYGYTMHFAERPVAEIFSAWAARRYNWQVDPARIEGLVDIVQGIYLTLQLYTKPGDSVVTLTPTYPPLWHSVANTDRRLIDCKMQMGADQYEIDFDKLADQLDSSTKLFLLCNPHNPTGRVFTQKELQGLAELVLQNDLIVLSDEIHADLVYAPNRHIPFASISPEIQQRTITMTSATKSFNIGGLRFALAIFGSKTLQDRFNTLPKGVIGGLNSMGAMASEIAWRDCDQWLDTLVSYLESNRNHLQQQIQQRFPNIKLCKPQATYLSWLDCQQLALNRDPYEHFLKAGKIAFGNGDDFGSGGDGFVRFNFATSQTIVDQILDRMAVALPST